MFVVEVADKDVTLRCIDKRPNVFTYLCYVCCLDSTNNPVSSYSIDKGSNTTVTLYHLLDEEVYTCVATSTDTRELSCDNSLLKGYLILRSGFFNFTSGGKTTPQSFGKCLNTSKFKLMHIHLQVIVRNGE